MSQYRKGYIFEKKSNSYIQEILETFKNLKFYSIESRGSKGTADIVFGIYDIKKKIEHGLAFNVKGDTYQAPKKNEKLKKLQK